MKRSLKIITIFLFINFFINNAAMAQAISQRNVPEKVIFAFENLNPAAKKVKWNKVKENYEVSFESNKKAYESTFSEDGIWLRTITAISEADLPQNAKDFINQKYKDKKPVGPAVEDNIKGRFFRVEIPEQDATNILYFDLQGNFLREEKE